MRRTRCSMGGNTLGENLSLGASAAVRPGRSPAEESYKGATLSKSSGRSPGQESSKGASLAVRKMNKGGYMEREDPRGMDRLEIDRDRNNKLAIPHYAKGGHTHKKVKEGLHSIYKMLHCHFGGGSEPEIKKKSGGNLWIQGAINPSNKGALHRSLHVPSGKKIPISKLHQAEHSKSPTLRKRARLAETLRGFHHKSQGR